MSAQLSPADRGYIRALQLLLGIDVYFLDVDQQMRFVGGMREEWNEVAKTMKDEGIEIPSMEELREAGAWYEADAFLANQFYAADSVRAAERKIPSFARNSLLPKYGVDLVDTQRTATTEEEAFAAIKETIQFVELIINKDRAEGDKVRLSDQDVLNIALSSPVLGFNAEELEGYGIEGFRNNVWVEEASAMDNLDVAWERLDKLFKGLGISPAYARSLRPQITEVERFWRDGREAGYSTADIFLKWVDEMPKRRNMELFGTPEDYWNMDKVPTAAKLRELEEKIREDVAIVTVASFITGIRPTPEDILYFVIYGANRLSNSQKKSLGLPIAKKLPQAQDPRTQPLIDLETLLETETIQSATGSTGMPPSLANALGSMT